MICVTHDREEALALGGEDRILELDYIVYKISDFLYIS